VTQSDKPFRVRQVQFDELDSETVNSWESLEDRALESNAFLSPRFVIPAMRHLGKPQELRQTMFVFVERANGGAADLVGAGVFVKTSGNRNFPLPHLRAFRSLHSYLSGILVDRDEAEGAVRAFFQFFCDKNATWHGVEFEYRPVDGIQAELITGVAEEFGSLWAEQERIHRAIFAPSEGGEAYIRSQFSSGRIKDLRRMRRRLEEQGDIHWRALFGNEVDGQSIERFLDIEHMGWKGENGTSLRSRPAHEAFFREMVGGFREKEGLFFTEMYLNNVVIASTSNLISGGTGFAFKIGWDPRYAKMGPGVLNEVEFIQRAPKLCGSLSYIDSGALEGSFIDQFWVGRRALASGIFGTTALGRKVLWGLGQMRRIKRWRRSRWKRDKK
jgi:Acetyltransferase (GNAT) domain